MTGRLIVDKKLYTSEILKWEIDNKFNSIETSFLAGPGGVRHCEACHEIL